MNEVFEVSSSSFAPLRGSDYQPVYYSQRLKSKNRSLIGLTTLGIGILVSDNVVDHPPPPPRVVVCIVYSVCSPSFLLSFKQDQGTSDRRLGSTAAFFPPYYTL